MPAFDDDFSNHSNVIVPQCCITFPQISSLRANICDLMFCCPESYSTVAPFGRHSFKGGLRCCCASLVDQRRKRKVDGAGCVGRLSPGYILWTEQITRLKPHAGLPNLGKISAT
jgi:hypothetical protein